jgi:hypothetical protein
LLSQMIRGHPLHPRRSAVYSAAPLERSENAMDLITTHVLFIVMPVAFGFVVNFLALLLLVNADLLWPDLARGGRQ